MPCRLAMYLFCLAASPGRISVDPCDVSASRLEQSPRTVWILAVLFRIMIIDAGIRLIVSLKPLRHVGCRSWRISCMRVAFSMMQAGTRQQHVDLSHKMQRRKSTRWHIMGPTYKCSALEWLFPQPSLFPNLFLET